MVRLALILILFIAYGNFNLVSNDLIIFSLINIAFFTALKEKKIKFIDIFIFILSTFMIEVFVGLPILIGVVVLFIPLAITNYFVNNYNFLIVIKSLIIFLLSLFFFIIIDQSIFLRLLNIQYLLSFFILTIIFLGLVKYGKE